MDTTELNARYQRDSIRVQAARRELAEQSFEGSSDDERVVVSVTADGYLDEVSLDPRVLRTPVDTAGLADRIKVAYRRGCEQAVARKNELYRPILGPEYDAGQLGPPTLDEEAAQARQVGHRLLDNDASRGQQ